MNGTIGRPRRILAVADTGTDQVAVRTALALATAHGAALDLVAIMEPPHDLAILSRLSGAPPDRLLTQAAERTRAEILARLSGILPDHPAVLELLVGKPYLEIIRHAVRIGCDLVVKTAEPLSDRRGFLFASVDQHLLRKCPCPVWLQTPSAAPRPGTVLAAVDLDLSDAADPRTLAALNRRVVDAACLIARGPEAEVVVLHAWEAEAEGMVWAFTGAGDARLSADRYVNEVLDARHRAMEDLLAEVRRGGGPLPRLTPRLVRGAPETVIRDACVEAGADVVVLGSVARTGLAGVFIGNTAENIVNSLECPVLAVKPDGFVSPLAPPQPPA